jgi:hypothetical protein
LVLLDLVGLGMMLQMASGNTMFQTIVYDKQRGRVMSFYSVAKIIKIANTILVGGIACILGALPFYPKTSRNNKRYQCS